MSVAAPYSLKFLRSRREEILRICARHGVSKVLLFGSWARDEAGPDSDLDILVDLTGERTAWWPGGLAAELEALLGLQVDVSTPGALHWYIREQVLAEAVEL